jgi:Protein of unknown function (DUF2637)
VTGALRVPRRAALAAIAALVAAASAVSFAESYRGLFLWAAHHGLTGPWAVIWPLQVDVFIAVGELALFVALADSWPPRSRFAAWTVTLAGLTASVAGNVGHIEVHSAAARATAAVPPLAAAAALAVGLGVLKRVVAMHGSTSVPAPLPAVPAPLASGHSAPEGGPEAARIFAADLASGALPSIRRIRREIRCGQPRAEQVQAYLAALAPGSAPGITEGIAASGAPAYAQVTGSLTGDRQSPAS